MSRVQLSTGSGVKPVFTSEDPLTVSQLQNRVEKITSLSKESFYIVHNGRLACEDESYLDGSVTIVPRLLGGKGGFGSMLRAIGAQIEKTTNREACRDLSGRRLRDINEEKRLKAWIEKQTKREEEAAERKKKKLERLCAEPKHEFKDQRYEKERSVLTERVGDAVEQGFKAAVAGTSGAKRKIEEETKTKRKTLLDLDIDSDELDTSDSDEDTEIETKSKKLKRDEVSNDSGHSSDESSKVSKDGAMGESEYSEASCDIQTDDNASNLESLKNESTAADPTERSASSSIESKEECLKESVDEKN